MDLTIKPYNYFRVYKMEGTMRPVDIAKKINISTSLLRHYEDREMIPPVSRGENNYRLYETTHLAYLQCIMGMKGGFGVELTEKVMKKLQQGDVNSAFELINYYQAEFFKEREFLKGILTKLNTKHLQSKGPKVMTIGELAEMTGVLPSAIRHWEKEGLITSHRQQGNDYRTFNDSHIKRIWLIQLLKSSNLFLGDIQEIIKHLNLDDEEQLAFIATRTQKSLQEKTATQIHGIHALYSLCETLNLVNKNEV